MNNGVVLWIETGNRGHVSQQVWQEAPPPPRAILALVDCNFAALQYVIYFVSK